MTFDNPLGYILSISMRMQNSIIIFHSVQDIFGHFSREGGSRTDRERTSVIIGHTESQTLTSLSVDFLRVVQYETNNTVTTMGHNVWNTLFVDKRENDKCSLQMLTVNGSHFPKPVKITLSVRGYRQH